MSLHRSLLSAALLAVACGCAQNEPQESTSSREIAKLERELADTRPASAEPAARTTAAPRVGTVVPEVVDLTAAAPLTPAATLSPQFAAAVNDGRGFIVRGLIIRTPPTPEAQVEADIAAARAKMHEAKALARSEDEQNVHLVLALMVIKDKEWQQAMAMSRRAGKSIAEYAPESAKLYDQIDACDRELRNWLNGDVDPAQLRQAACMTEARTAAAMAGVR